MYVLLLVPLMFNFRLYICFSMINKIAAWNVRGLNDPIKQKELELNWEGLGYLSKILKELEGRV